MVLDLQPLSLPGIPDNRPLVIAGPCSAETEEQMMNTALSLKEAGFGKFRAGSWKPRTKPGGFERNGIAALPWLRRVHEELDMLTATEVATAEHVRAALDYGVDILWIGARTAVDSFAVQSVANALKGEDIPVLVKNPVNPELDLWQGALKRVNLAGIKRLGAIHRGFSYYDRNLYRNLPRWHIPQELHRREPDLPIFCDPSHIGGKRELIAPLCRQAMEMGMEGLIVESHCNPDSAWSDAAQQVTPAVLKEIIDGLMS